MDEGVTERAKRYRDQAAQIRAAAQDMRDPESRAAMLRLAESYERLASKVEGEGERKS